MLETTRNTEFVPGTNLKGDMVAADWRFLLPSLQYRQVVCLGVPPLSTVCVLARMAERVLVCGTKAERLVNLNQGLHRRKISNVKTSVIRNSSGLGLAQDSVELIYLVERGFVKQFLKGRKLSREVSEVLKTNGVVFLKLNSLRDRFLVTCVTRSFSRNGFSSPRQFWMAPALGRMRVAVPLQDLEVSRFF